MAIRPVDKDGNILPRNPMWTRLTGNVLRREVASVSKVEPEKEVDPFEGEAPKFLERAPEVPAKSRVDELREAVGAIPAKKMGRPSKGQPWKEAGISKAAWYKRQQKERSDG